MTMGEQLYRLDEYWREDEWPFTLEPDEIIRLNRVLPRCYSFVIECNQDDGEIVSLLEYVGEYDMEELGDE